MFNSKYKKECIGEIENSIERYDEVYSMVEYKAEKLFHIRENSGEIVIKPVEDYINQLANSPKNLINCFLNIKLNLKRSAN